MRYPGDRILCCRVIALPSLCTDASGIDIPAADMPTRLRVMSHFGRISLKGTSCAIPATVESCSALVGVC